MKALLHLVLFLFIAIQCLTAQQNNRYGNITPGQGGSYEKLKEDKLGFIYTVQYFTVDQKAVLWQFNGTDWKVIELNQNGWKSIIDYEIDSLGHIYILANTTTDNNPKIYKYQQEKWDSILSLNGIKGIFLNHKQELMAFGNFGNPGQVYFIATWMKNQWVPMHAGFENSFLKDQFNEKHLVDVMSEHDGSLLAYISFYKKPETRNYYCQLKQGIWKLLNTSFVNMSNKILDFSPFGNEDDFITEAATFGNQHIVIAGPGGNAVYCLRQGETVSKYNQ